MDTFILSIALSAIISKASAADVVKTNLPATITSETVTNVIEGDNKRGCSMCEMLRKNPTYAVYHPGHLSDEYKAADEKWIVTNIVRRTTICVEWGGGCIRSVSDKPISSTTNRWKLRANWIKD